MCVISAWAVEFQFFGPDHLLGLGLELGLGFGLELGLGLGIELGIGLELGLGWVHN